MLSRGLLFHLWEIGFVDRVHMPGNDKIINKTLQPIGLAKMSS